MRNPDAIECLELMLPLCESVSDRIERYGITAENIATNNDYFDLVLMPIFQIGELEAMFWTCSQCASYA